MPLPSGWRVVGPADSYPVAVLNDQSNARLLIFRSELTEPDLISNSHDFQTAIDQVLDSVVLQLPYATLLTSTGYYEKNYAWFVVEFRSTDTAAGHSRKHRLAGSLYRHAEGYQLLYTLWGKALIEDYSMAESDLVRMQQGFRYVGPQAELVFPPGEGNDSRWMVLLLLAVVVVFFLMRRRQQSRPDRVTNRAPTWKCECGRINHIDAEKCRRCGKPNERPF